MKRLGLPVWFPYPGSWLNALILSVLMSGFVAIIRNNGGFLLNLAQSSSKPELFTGLLILLMLLPIPAFALLHHFFLGRFIPPIPGEKIAKIQGLFPGLISWWESLYSWLVFLLSTLTAILFCTPLLPLFQLNYQEIINNSSPNYRDIQGIFTICWLMCAAIFYQVEYLFKRRLVSGEFVNLEAETANLETSLEAEVETVQSEIAATQVETNETSTTTKPTKSNSLAKHGKLVKRLFTFVVIGLVGTWMYLFANLPEVQQKISGNLSFENPLQPSTKPVSDTSKSDTLPKQIDIFDKASSQAKRAGRLTQSAQSPDEWKMVITEWEDAITLMKSVPPNNPNYVVAQEKLIDYQIHLNFAQQYIVQKN